MKEPEDMTIIGPVIEKQQKIVNDCVEKKISLSKLQSSIWEKSNNSSESFSMADLDDDASKKVEESPVDTQDTQADNGADNSADQQDKSGSDISEDTGQEEDAESDVDSQEELTNRVATAAFFGTLQAGFSDFHYLRPIWAKTTQKDALLGIGMTGIGSGEILKYDLKIAASTAKMVNSMVSAQIGTNEAARITCIKPSGTTSLVLGTASGIHAWHNDYYLRTMRFNKNEDIASYLMVNHPELCEDDVLRPTDTVCVRIPVKAPEGSILRTETAIDTLERVKRFATEWIVPGHINGDNTHNVSATISIDKDRRYSEEH